MKVPRHLLPIVFPQLPPALAVGARGTMRGMRHVNVMCELIGQQDGKKYPAKLDLMLKPINTDEEDNIGEILQTADLAPGQRIPDGNYTRLPYQFEPNEKRVRVERGRMLVGWL
jgi:hypothetical protein